MDEVSCRKKKRPLFSTDPTDRSRYLTHTPTHTYVCVHTIHRNTKQTIMKLSLLLAAALAASTAQAFLLVPISKAPSSSSSTPLTRRHATVTVGPASEIPNGERKVVDTEAGAVIVANVGGEFYAVNAKVCCVCGWSSRWGLVPCVAVACGLTGPLPLFCFLHPHTRTQCPHLGLPMKRGTSSIIRSMLERGPDAFTQPLHLGSSPPQTHARTHAGAIEVQGGEPTITCNFHKVRFGESCVVRYWVCDSYVLLKEHGGPDLDSGQTKPISSHTTLKNPNPPPQSKLQSTFSMKDGVCKKWSESVFGIPGTEGIGAFVGGIGGAKNSPVRACVLIVTGFCLVGGEMA